MSTTDHELGNAELSDAERELQDAYDAHEVYSTRTSPYDEVPERPPPTWSPGSSPV